jgi:putative transposase
LPQKATVVAVSEGQRALLEKMKRARWTPRGRAERAQIVLMTAEGMASLEQARRLRVDRQRVRRWRNRWAEAEGRLAAAEEQGASDKDLERLVREVLSDRQRPGGPTRFTPEQVTDLIALAWETPSDSGLPISHWTPPDLAGEAVRRGIVDSSSPRHLDRYLKRSRPQAAQTPLLAHVA